MQTRSMRHIIWSTDTLDLDDPFQRRLFIRQTLLHGRTEDVRRLDKAELAAILDELNLPEPVYQLWKRYLTRLGLYVGR
ncbi:MAG: hypothetical protein NZM28_01035 [Fimbriimonadales bacterium]|nr:hypothetical protein [Fimbriimonadales bacterium]MCX7925506.1 hypothetical protein [Fimbriimonadales bacterium]